MAIVSMRGSQALAHFVLAFALTATPGLSDERVSPDAIATRSLLITDRQILSRFPFLRLFAVLTSGHQREIASWVQTLELQATHSPANRASRSLPTELGAPPYWDLPRVTPWSYIEPLAIVNRLDLAASDHSTCGDVRFIYSRRTAHGKMHIAVDIPVVSPRPERHAQYCGELAKAWWSLAAIESVDARAHELDRLLFGGKAGALPLIDRDAFINAGRIRTSELSRSRPTFAEFKVDASCAHSGPCAQRHLQRVRLANTPSTNLFDASVATPQGEAFRRVFLKQIRTLAVRDVNEYSMSIDVAYAVTEMPANAAAFNYQIPFRRSLRSDHGIAFRQAIASELKLLGSPLTPENIIDRAETRNCGGCHGKTGAVGDGIVAPEAFDSGEHIADDSPIHDARRSPALRGVFLPYRIELLMRYINVAADSK
jgi:hypothetical protein